MERDALTKKRWFWVGVFVAAWTAMALLGSVELYVAQLKFEKPVAWALAMRRSFEEVYTFGLLVAGVLWFCGRVRFEPGHFRRWFFAHLGVSVIFSVLFLAIVSWLWAGQKSVQTGNILQFPEVFQKLAISYTFSSVCKYWFFVLGHLAWQYYKRYREREKQAAALATELVQARLQALRMQINPHFLFNTLNTISALIHEQPDAADRMIVRLSELLRRTLDRGDTQEVPLREEIEFLKGYLEIEQMRFQDRLSVTFDVEPRTHELLVPHLILQPLVENALRHGIEPREEPGRICVSARVDGDALALCVRDNGNGLSQGKGEPRREGIGLRNIRSRLEQLYGGSQTFEVRDADGGGVEACVRIPCCTIPRSHAPRVVVTSASESGDLLSSLPVTVSAKPDCC